MCTRTYVVLLRSQATIQLYTVFNEYINYNIAVAIQHESVSYARTSGASNMTISSHSASIIYTESVASTTPQHNNAIIFTKLPLNVN